MKYIDSEILQLLIWLLFAKKKPCPDNCCFAFEDDNNEDIPNCYLESFNRELRKFVEQNKENKLDSCISFLSDKKDDGYIVNIKLTNRNLLLAFLQNYIEQFKSGSLEGNYFLYEKQLEYFKKELEYYKLNYGDKFNLSGEFKTKDNIAECLRLFELVLLLHFKGYLNIIDAEKIRKQESVFDICLSIELLKPINKIFDELLKEIDEYPYKFKKIETDMFTENSKHKKINLKGKIVVAHKKGGQVFIEKECYRKAFEYFTRLNATEEIQIKIEDAIKDIGINPKSSEDYGKETLENYINRVNKALKTLYFTDDIFIKIKDDKLLIKIPKK